MLLKVIGGQSTVQGTFFVFFRAFCCTKQIKDTVRGQSGQEKAKVHVGGQAHEV